MEYLNWELSLLQRSVLYPNLSVAATHVGISQPQLSRIIAKLEKELGLPLLNRESKRKATWTEHAYKIANTYSSLFRNFQGEIQKITQGTEISHLRIGTLEGMISIVLPLAQKIFHSTSVRILEILVKDIHELEGFFLKGELDLIFTIREITRKKLPFIKLLGHQNIEIHSLSNQYQILTPFEYGSSNLGKKQTATNKFPLTLISNSLEVRRRWLHDYGGSASIPSEVLTGKPNKNSVPVLCIGSPSLPTGFWKKIFN